MRPRDLSEHRLWHPGEAEMVVLGAEDIAVADAVEKKTVLPAVVEDGRPRLVVEDKQRPGGAKRAGLRVVFQGSDQGAECKPRHVEAVIEAQGDGWWRRRGPSPQFWETGSKRGRPVGAGEGERAGASPAPTGLLRPPRIGAGGRPALRRQQKYPDNYSQA